MKLNNKGFAISSIMYMILVLGVILLSLILATLSSRRLILEKLKNETIKYILNEPICTLISDSDSSGSITIGDKYSCEVKDDVRFNFYVLSFNDDGSPNLIMERNICEDGTVATEENTCLVAYNVDEGAVGVGPVTAMNYLSNATSSWLNISSLDIKYNDEGGNFTNFAVTGKARMPYYSEVDDYNNTNKYLYDYLNLDGNIQLNSIFGIEGYWIFSSTSDGGAYLVYYDGRVYNDPVDYSYGVRPVITVPIDKIEN